MIEQMTLRDLGVIAEATLPIGPGFTAITGETGAGKTMVVTGLGLLLGQRSDSGAVRAGAAQASVEGVWIVPPDGAVAERVREAGADVGPGHHHQTRARLLADPVRAGAATAGLAAAAHQVVRAAGIVAQRLEPGQRAEQALGALLQGQRDRQRAQREP